MKPKATPAKARDKKKNNGKPDRNVPPVTSAKLLAGPVVDLTKFEDVRQPLMDWLRAPENPLFARAFVNRVWANYFNVGIVQPSDDMNLANPPVNKALLDYLAAGFIEHNFDMKWLHREILNSRTYQLSWVPNSTNRLDERNFSRAVPRRIPAEIAYDMMVQATRNDAKNLEFVTELEKRAVSIPGSGLRNRNRNPADYAMTVFGRSTRESNCDCDRTEEPSLLQTIFVRNDNQLLSMIDDGEGWLQDIATKNSLTFSRKSFTDAADSKKDQRNQARDKYKGQIRKLKDRLVEAEKNGKAGQVKSFKEQIAKLRAQAEKVGVTDAEVESTPAAAVDSAKPEAIAASSVNFTELINQAYLRTLSRYPTEEEVRTSQAYISESTDAVDGVRGVLWALLNTREFMVNH